MKNTTLANPSDWLVTILLMYQAMLGFAAVNPTILGLSPQTLAILAIIGVGVAVLLNRLDPVGAGPARQNIVQATTTGIALADGLSQSTIDALKATVLSGANASVPTMLTPVGTLPVSQGPK